ncbi:hypothetical protein R5O87_19780 [Arthrobacter globiformis]|uniref:hypothetical protein n=1 Tax=Arthrobacter globiformis TaxID=1665 RepID=UPI0039781C60
MEIEPNGRRAICALLLSLLIVACHAAPAIADSTDVFWNTDGVGVWHFDTDNNVWVDAPASAPESPYQYKFTPLCLVANNDFDIACLAASIKCTEGKDGRPVRWWWKLRVAGDNSWTAIRPDRCVYNEDPSDVLGRIAAQIQRRFEQLPVNAGTLGIQPRPHTLRGAETNFYGESAEQSFDVTMLGQKVHIVAKPVQYRWDYGDGTSLGPTTTMGGPLPQDRWGEKTRTSHAYAATGDFNVVLTTYFQGTYSVNGGPNLPIPNQGQFSSPPQTVSVWRSVTRNYADDCNTNPRGDGCPGAAPGNR